MARKDIQGEILYGQGGSEGVESSGVGLARAVPLAPPDSLYHPFQNHYTHETTIFELFRGLQLQLLGVFRIN